MLGTFIGEISRAGNIRDAAIKKARLVMAVTGLSTGIASEGSYGPHPHIPFVAGGIELMVIVDDVRNIVVSEYLIENAPVYDHAFVQSIDELGAFLDRIEFPDHALIVKAIESGVEGGPIHKGLRDKDGLE